MCNRGIFVAGEIAVAIGKCDICQHSGHYKSFYDHERIFHPFRRPCGCKRLLSTMPCSLLGTDLQ